MEERAFQATAKEAVSIRALENNGDGVGLGEQRRKLSRGQKRKFLQEPNRSESCAELVRWSSLTRPGPFHGGFLSTLCFRTQALQKCQSLLSQFRKVSSPHTAFPRSPEDFFSGGIVHCTLSAGTLHTLYKGYPSLQQEICLLASYFSTFARHDYKKYFTLT